MICTSGGWKDASKYSFLCWSWRNLWKKIFMFYRPAFDRIMCCIFHNLLLHVRSMSKSRTKNASWSEELALMALMAYETNDPGGGCCYCISTVDERRWVLCLKKGRRSSSTSEYRFNVVFICKHIIRSHRCMQSFAPFS